MIAPSVLLTESNELFVSSDFSVSFRACVRILEPWVPSSKVVGIICPLVRIGLTDLPKSAGARQSGLKNCRCQPTKC